MIKRMVKELTHGNQEIVIKGNSRTIIVTDTDKCIGGTELLIRVSG